MMYATPKTVLTALASRGSSGTRAEALRLLASELPDDWPDCPRRSRRSLLRRLACDRKKSAKARLAALQEVLKGVLKPDAAPEALPTPSTVEQPSTGSTAISSTAPSTAPSTGASADTQKELSTAILRAAGKTHLSELAQQEWARHLMLFSWQERLELDRQRGEWLAPDQEILDAMGLSRLTYWQGVLARATTEDVRQNAQREIKRLESSDGN